METQIVECKKYPGEWLVESINHASEGECYVTRFSGPSAEPRARQYAAGLCDHCVGTRYESEERECEFCT